MQVRAMRVEDAEQVAELCGQLGYPSGAADLARRFHRMQDGPPASAFVAEAPGGRVAGWIHVYGQYLLESDPYAEIGGLVIDATARRQGVGHLLIRAAEVWAREAGFDMVNVRSNTARVEARPFYLKEGYEIVKTQYCFRKRVDLKSTK